MGQPKPKVKKKKTVAQLQNLCKAWQVLTGIQRQDDDTNASRAGASAWQNISEKLHTVTSKLKITQTQLYNERRKVQRAKATSSLAKQKARSAEKENQVLGKEIEELTRRKEVEEQEQYKKEKGLGEKISRMEESGTRMRTTLRNMTKRVKRISDVKLTASRRATKQATEFSLKERGGAFSMQAREMAREMVNCGVPERKVGDAIQKIGKAMGMNVTQKMSEGTVRRAVLEGGVMADVQLGYELSSTSDITYSSDSTSHKHVEHESRTVALRAATYSGIVSDVTASESPHWVQRSLGIDTSVDHSSATQLSGLKARLSELSETYKSSPLARREESSFDADDFIFRCRATSGDHAADQFKGHRMMGDWKLKDLEMRLGLEAVKTGDYERMPSEDEIRRVGREKLSQMPEEERRKLTMFIRAGCSMHKDLNTVKGGDEAMKSWWEESGNTPPMLLPNKWNAAALSTKGSAHTKKETEVSKRGATQLTTLAGMILKNKDTKKGQQDIYTWWMHNEVGYSVPFADVSNTRYGSHGEAACLLVVYRQQYLKFMEELRDGKEKPGFTNPEKNVYDALGSCIPTLTELVVHALYCVLISQPFMAHVRTHSNILLLGPFFSGKIELMQEVIDEPALWLGASVNPKTAMLEGTEFTEWTTMVVGAVHQLLPSLPHVIGALIAFLEGTKTTFRRFIEEFREGGDISQMSDGEKEDLFVPSTNDLNEGALGKVRLSKRARPNQTLLSHNSRQLYQNNETADFAQNKLQTREDQLFVRKLARQHQVSGRSRKTRERHMEHKKLRVLENRKRLMKRVEAERARQAQLEATRKALILDNSEIDKLKVPELDKQLRFHREEEKRRNSAVRIPTLTGLNKGRKQEELKRAVSRWLEYEGEAMHVGSDEDISDLATDCAVDLSDSDES